MSKTVIGWIICAVALIIIGSALFSGALFKANFDFLKLSNKSYKTATYDINEDYNNIKINVDTADIEFIISKDGKSKVESLYEEKAEFAVKVEDETLLIEENDNRKWYDYITVFGVDSPEIKVYLSKKEFNELIVATNTGDVEIAEGLSFKKADISGSTGDVDCDGISADDLKIKLSTGDMELKNVKSSKIQLAASTGDINAKTVSCEGDIEIKLTTGDIELQNVKSKNISTVGSTGETLLKSVISEEKLMSQRSTGDIILKGCDAAELELRASTGDVKGSLLSEKIFIAKASTGNVNVPESSNGGKCKITTTTGDIKIAIE